MVLTPRLDMRQTQGLVMTPQLQQAIKLLQLSNLELSEYVDQELEQNPLLELGEAEGSEPGADAEPEAAAPAEETASPADTADTLSASAISGDAADGGEGMDVDVDNVYTNDSASDGPASTQSPDSGYESYGPGGSYGDGDLPGIEQTLADEESMRAHLLAELGMLIDTPHERLIGLELIDMLDEAGYLQGGLEETAERLGCTMADMEAVLVKLQTVDPPGLFARNLSECLGLQLKDKDRLDPAMQALLDNLELMAKRDLKGLMKVCGVDEDDILDMVDEIRALDPKPGRAFTHDVAQPVIPDVILRPAPGGGWTVELNSETLPRVLVNNRYYAEISQGMKKAEDKRYIQDCLQSANWLVKSLHQRATTIMKVSSEIVRKQDAFLREGVSALKPMVLRDISEAIEMHESTVSRVTSNKYMATPRGIFELKYFFSSSVGGGDGGEAHAALSVKSRIQALIDGEDKKKVLSDDKLVEILKAEGIDVARRTVAKYRDALGLASSVQRRREKSGDF